MPINTTDYQSITAALAGKATLVAVSKTKPAADIEALYTLGQRDFGENYVQELVDKAAALPAGIRWHFIGHLQRNKVKYIAPFVHLIHGVDSMELLREINKQALKNNRTIDCLLQVCIAREETKFGLDEAELDAVIKEATATALSGINIRGLMGMASFSNDKTLVNREFQHLRQVFDRLQTTGIFTADRFNILSMGMSGDYPLALEAGSTMVRIGSLLFGSR